MPGIRARFMPLFRASKKTLRENPLPPCTYVQGGTIWAGCFQWVVTKTNSRELNHRPHARERRCDRGQRGACEGGGL